MSEKRRERGETTGVSGRIAEGIWSVVTWPFRMLFGLVTLFGRSIAGVIGFGLMVFGAMAIAGEWYLSGSIIVFLGLVILVRALRG